MSLIYHFTSGVNAGGSGPWDTGRAGVHLITKPTTRQQVFDAVVEALSGVTGAGWTETAASTATRRIFTSAGESGNENIVITLQQGASIDSRYVQFGAAPKVDAGGNPQAYIGFGASTFESVTDTIDLGTTDETFELQIFATLDFIWVFVIDTSDSFSHCAFAGNLVRFGYNTSVGLVDVAGASAGNDVSIPITVNPNTFGWRVGDALQICETAAASSPLAENVLVTDVTTTSIRVRTLQNTYTANARVGCMPCPVFVGHWVNSSFDTGEAVSTSTNNRWRSPFRFLFMGETQALELCALDTGALDEFRGQGGYITSQNTRRRLKVDASTNEGYGVNTTPETRTNEFIVTSISLVHSGTGGNSYGSDSNHLPGKGILGLVPFIYSYPGSASFLTHDNFVRRTFPSAVEDFLPVYFNHTEQDEVYVLGPTPGP